jgi:hypothetical protein
VTQWLVFARSPGAREAFGLMCDFMQEVFRPDALVHVRAVFLVDREGAGDAAETARRMGLRRAARALQFFHERGAPYGGIYVPGEGAAVVLHAPAATRVRLYFVTAHEMGHAVTLAPGRMRGLVSALAGDLPELAAAYRHLLAAPLRAAAVWHGLAENLKRVAFDIAAEVPANVIAHWYFVELRREVAPASAVADPASASALEGLRSDVLDAYFRLSEELGEEELARLGRAVQHATDALAAAAEKLRRGELPRLARKVHEILAASIRAWPADVMEREPRYRALLERAPVE